MDTESEKLFVYSAMQKYGGSFVKALGIALMHADADNCQRLKNAFPEYWNEYLEMGKKDSKVVNYDYHQ